MLDFTINHIIGEAYNKVLTGRGVLEASQETNYTPTTNNVQDKVYEDAVRKALNSLGLKDYPKRTALLTKIMGRIASRPKNRSYQDQINYIYNYYKNIGKNDLANKIVSIANHIFSKNNTHGQTPNNGNIQQPNSTENTGDNTNANQPTNNTQTTNNVQDVKITDEVVKNAMQSLGYRAGHLDYKSIARIMKSIARASKENRYQEELNRWYNVYKESNLGFANRIVNIANHIFLKNNNTQKQAPVQSDSTPYKIDIDYDILKLAEKRFDVHGDSLNDIKEYLDFIFGNVAEIGYPAARKKTMEEMRDFVGIDTALDIADYINQNKAQYIKSPEENKKNSDGMRKAYQQNISTHNDVMKHQQSLNKTQQTNNQAGYSSGNVNRSNSAGKLRTGSTSFNNASTQKNNKPSSSQTNRQPTYSRNNQQSGYTNSNNSSKGNLSLGTTFIVDDDE